MIGRRKQKPVSVQSCNSPYIQIFKGPHARKVNSSTETNQEPRGGIWRRGWVNGTDNRGRHKSVKGREPQGLKKLEILLTDCLTSKCPFR
jgi:hypothetical protein